MVIRPATISGTSSSVVSGAPRPVRRRTIFAIVSMALMMASVDQTIVATALPSLQQDLHARINWSSWTITAYALGQVLVMPLAGRLGDQFGRKRIFLGAVTVFTLASLSCGLASNIYLLVVLRAVQAIGGGALMPSATGIVAEHFGKDRDRALGLFSSVFSLGGIAGPILGGIVVTYLSWRWIFLVNVPIGVLLLGLGAALIPASERLTTQRLDVVGVALVGCTLVPAMLGIALVGEGHSMGSVGFLAPEAIGLVGLVLFVRHTRYAEAPFISVRLLVGRGFGVMNLVNFMFGCAALGFGALVPLYAEQRYHIPELQAGTLLTARAVGMIAMAALSVMLLRRTGYRMPMLFGFILVAIGLIGLATRPHGAIDALTWLAVAAGITGVGMGFATPASNNATLQLAPEQAAAVAGLRGMFRHAGAITSVSITAAILARSSDPGVTQGVVFAVFAGVILCVLPLVFRVPEHRGSW
jgi:EmrB/QacA subfamily drug resistance transporter